MALAQIAEIGRLKLCERSAQTGSRLLALLSDVAADVNRRNSGKWKLARPDPARWCGYRAMARGVGLMAALELRRADGLPATREVLDLVKAMLSRGLILLPEGEHANIVSFSPPLTISEKQVDDTVRVLAEELGRLL
jgi:4-aminobutyrate aminotransferase-like enzyme